MRKEDITHQGVVKRVERDYLVIRTEDVRQCDGCAVVALCNSKNSGSNEPLTVDCADARNFSAGDRVVVTASSGSTLRAAWWALILPTLIFAAFVLGCRIAFPSLGGWSIAIGFAALGLYDLFLYWRRKSLAQKVSWKVTKI